MTYRFHPAAEAEHLRQIQFYEARHRGLGARYLNEFVQTMERVCEAPGRFAIAHPPDIRRAGLLRPFPQSVIYRERNGIVQVLAVAHHRRRPDYWLGRER